MLTRFISDKESYYYKLAQEMGGHNPVYTTQQQLYSFSRTNTPGARNGYTLQDHDVHKANKKQKARFKDSSGELLIHPVFEIQHQTIDLEQTVLFSFPYFVELHAIDVEENGQETQYWTVKSAGKIIAENPVNYLNVVIPYTDLKTQFWNTKNTEQANRYIRDVRIPDSYDAVLMSPNLWLILGDMYHLPTYALLQILEDEIIECNLWEPKRHGPTPNARQSYAYCGNDGLVYVYGGQGMDESVLSDLWVFKAVPTEKEWVTKDTEKLEMISYEVMVGEMETPRFDHMISVIGRKLIAYGGKSSKFQDILSVEILDLDTLIWTTLNFQGPEFPTSLYYTQVQTFTIGSMIFVYVPDYDAIKISIAVNLDKYDHMKGLKLYHELMGSQIYIWLLDIDKGHSQVAFHLRKKVKNACEVGLLSNGLIYEIQDGRQMTLNQIAPGNIYQVPQCPAVGAGLSISLEVLLKSEARGDVNVIAGSEQFLAHKICLIAREDESRSLLDQLSPDGVLDLSNYAPYPIVYAAILYLYTDKISVPTFDSASKPGNTLQKQEEFWQQLLQFAEQFHMLTLKLYCVLSLEQGCQFWGSSSALYADYRNLYKMTFQGESFDKKGFGAILKPDFTLICENDEFPCHSLFICLHSSYLRALLHHTPGITSAQLENTSPQAIPYVLQFIYYDNRDIPDTQLFDVFVASQNLGIPALFDICQKEISLKILPNNFSMIYEAAVLLGAAQLVQYCENWARQFSFLMRKVEIGPETQRLLDTFEKPPPRPKKVNIDITNKSEQEVEEIKREYLEKYPLPNIFENFTPPGLSPIITLKPHEELLQNLLQYTTASPLAEGLEIPPLPVLSASNSIEVESDMCNPFAFLQQEICESDEDEEEKSSN